jgi:hypothetical protein
VSKIFATNALDPPHWTPNSCFGVSRTVLLLHELICKMGWSGAINAQVHATKSRWNFSQRTHLIHHIWPQTHVLAHFGMFHYYMNFGTKWAKLMQLMHKFFTTNTPDPPHWTPNSCFGAFQTITLLHESRHRTGWIGATYVQVRATKSRWNFKQWRHPIHPILTQTHVFGRFRTIQCWSKVGAKRIELVQLMHKFV